MARQYRIASVPADGIGPEVISAGLEVLDAVDLLSMLGTRRLIRPPIP